MKRRVKKRKSKGIEMQVTGKRTTDMIKKCICASSLIHISMLEVKATMCKLLRHIFVELKPIYFWPYLLGLFLIYFIINLNIADYFMFLMYGPVKKERRETRAPLFFRRTRRGTIYGAGY